MNKVILKNDLLLKKKSLIIWTCVCVGVMLFLMAFFPLFESVMNEMAATMSEIMNIEGLEESFTVYQFASGYFATEIGTMYQLIAVLFAAFVGVGAWSKEEKNKTAEFVLTMPISRKEIWTTKLLSIIIQILIFSVTFIIFSTLTVLLMDLGVAKTISWGDLLGIVVGLVEITILQIIIGLLCFALSGIMNGVLNVGVAIAFSLGLYVLDFFISIVATVFANKWSAELTNILSRITPFGCTNPMLVWQSFSDHNMGDMKYFWISLIFLAVWLGLAILLTKYSYKKFNKKDIPN